MKSAPPHQRRSIAGLTLLMVAIIFTPALALDQNRALTQYNHRIWQVQQGLPQAAIYTSLQARDGFIWLGTLTGLIRFDGVRFTPITNIGSISFEGVWVRSLVEDRDGALWVGTDGNGLFKISHGVAAHFDITTGLPSNIIHTLSMDVDGTLWVATGAGLGKLSRGEWSWLGSQRGIDCNDIRAITRASDGKLWVAGADLSQMYSGDGTSFTHIAIGPSPMFTNITSIAPGRDGGVWVGTSNGLLLINRDQQKWFTSKDGLADDNINCLNQSDANTLWIGTKNGFSRMRNDTFESFRAKDGLSQSSVFTLMQDHEGSLWVGTKHGLNQFTDRRAIPFTVNEGLTSNETGAVFQDRAGGIWVGTQDAGLCRFNGRRFTSAGQIGSPAISIAQDSGDGLWIGSDHGLSLLRDGQVVKTITDSEGLPSNKISCTYQDSQGILWIGTNAGIAAMHDRKIIHLPGLDSAEHSPILAIGGYHDSILIATPEGLWQYTAAKLVPFLDDQTPAASWVRDVDSLYEDHTGLIWIGTRGSGLRLVDGNRQFTFSVRDGLFDDDIFGIAVDDFDRVWMACSKGVFWVQRADLLSLAAGRIKAVSSFPFSPTDNLRTVECQADVQPVVFKSSDGKIWFSTIRGVIVFDPAHLQRTNTVPPAIVEEVVVNGQSEDAGQIYELSPGQRNLEFRYAGLSFASPTQMKFRYQLEGFDRDWIDASTRREAFYTNLSPGKYRFKVMASYPETSFTGEPAMVAFTLLPRFYQRAWFFPVVACILVASAVGAYRTRMRRVRERIAAIVAERSRIARELHDTLLQGFSGVTMEMQALSMRLASQQDRGILLGIIQDAAACMREARRSVAGLRNPRGEQGLAAAIEQSAAQVTETHNLRLRLKLSPDIPLLSPETEYNLLRITQEAVTNAVKHAAASIIEISLAAKSGELRIVVKDDGRGFDPAGDLEGQHFGLIGIRERASSINAGVQVESKPGRGTSVTVMLPIKPRPGSGEAVSSVKVIEEPAR